MGRVLDTTIRVMDNALWMMQMDDSHAQSLRRRTVSMLREMVYPNRFRENKSSVTLHQLFQMALRRSVLLISAGLLRICDGGGHGTVKSFVCQRTKDVITTGTGLVYKMKFS